MGMDEFYGQGMIYGAEARHTKEERQLLYLQQIFHNCSLYWTPFSERYEWCGTDEENIDRLGTKECSEWNSARPQMNQDLCRRRSTTVLKTIRFLRIKDLYKIRHIENVNLKIIHLIRDPRAMMTSRRTGGYFFITGHHTLSPIPKAENEVKLAWEAHNQCQKDVDNMEFVERSDSAWLKSRYMLVKHRDMSLEPLATAQRMYDFIGISLGQHVKDYLVNISHGVYNGGETKGLATAKVSAEILDNWKKPVHRKPDIQLQIIEDACKGLMERLNIPFELEPLKMYEHLNPFYD